jgi:hypothetical protein
VKWARRNGVNVISMSWSVAEQNRNFESIRALQNAIAEAHRENILMFCAANDEGIDVRSNQTFPASCKDKVFCIGAAESTGQLDANVGDQYVDFTGEQSPVFVNNPPKITFRVVPGKVVLEMDDGKEGQVYAGSSVSTALAAGLVWFPAQHQHPFMSTDIPPGILDTLLRRDQREA